MVSKILYFYPDPWGFMIQFDVHIFQMGWFNHQLGSLWEIWKMFIGRFLFQVGQEAEEVLQATQSRSLVEVSFNNLGPGKSRCYEHVTFW